MLADTYNVDGASPGLLLSHNNFLPLSRHIHDAEQKYVSIILWRHQHEDAFHVREITPQNLRRHLREDGFHLHEIIPQNLQKCQYKDELHLLKMTLPNLTKTNHDKEEKLDQGV